jgi:hypothetical protein
LQDLELLTSLALAIETETEEVVSLMSLFAVQTIIVYKIFKIFEVMIMLREGFNKKIK